MKKVLILLPDIWSMTKGKGMRSIHNFLSASDKEFECVIFTTDKNEVEADYPNSKVYQFKRKIWKSNNRFIQYLFDRISNLDINLQYLIKAVKVNFKPELIYCASAVPVFASKIISIYHRCKVVHRIYGTFLYENITSKLDKLKKFEEVCLFLFKADKYIITNDGTRGDRVAQYYNIPCNKIEFLLNGVDKNEDAIFDLKSNFMGLYGIPSDAFVAICVSRLSSWKRVDRIVTAFNLISDQSIHILIVGDGPQRDEWEALAINKNIHFTGSLSSQEVKTAMHHSDLFISMYDYSNVGNPLLEALTSGMPILAYASGGTEDVISDGINGAIINRKDSEDDLCNDLKKNILLLKNNPQLRASFSDNAQEYSKMNIKPWEERINDEVNILKKMLDY